LQNAINCRLILAVRRTDLIAKNYQG
jgi:hypothetical protein